MKGVLCVLVVAIMLATTNKSFSQDFKAGDISLANDEKPKAKVSYDQENHNVTFHVTDGGDNAGMQSLVIEDSVYFLSGVVDTIIIQMVYDLPIKYVLKDIGGNTSAGEFKKKSVYDDAFVVPSFTISSPIGLCSDYCNISLYYGIKTSAGDNCSMPFYKYKGIMLSYDFNYNSDSVYYSDKDIKAGYMFGEAYAKMHIDKFGVSGYGCEIIPFAKYSIINDKFGVGVISSVYYNYSILGFENILSSEYINGSFNYSNKTSFGIFLGAAGTSFGYEFGTSYGKKFNYFKIDFSLKIPFFYGYRPEHKQLEK